MARGNRFKDRKFDPREVPAGTVLIVWRAGASPAFHHHSDFLVLPGLIQAMSASNKDQYIDVAFWQNLNAIAQQPCGANPPAQCVEAVERNRDARTKKKLPKYFLRNIDRCLGDCPRECRKRSDPEGKSICYAV